jgi:hypothetical protein
MHPSSSSRRLLAACLCLPLPFAAHAQASPAAADSAAVARVQATDIARSFTFRYLMQRGSLRGTCELGWVRKADAYEARLQGMVAGFAVLDWASSGGFDAAGVAPTRYVEHRLGKSDRDASFRKSESRIVFSGSHSSDIPYVPGVQDRVSWLLQLPAIVAGDPARTRAGTRVAMHVVGTRGHAGDWIFESEGRETIKTPAGTLHTVKWTRKVRKPEDTQAEVWLDIERHYLPVRIRLAIAASEAPLEMTLADASP